jgi:hypothetical protein
MVFIIDTEQIVLGALMLDGGALAEVGELLDGSELRQRP